MFTASTLRRTCAAISGFALVTTGALLIAATLAGPVSGTPPEQPTGCRAQPGVYVCDGPIHPDQTFRRCWITRPIMASRNQLIPSRSWCWTVDLANRPLFGNGLPQHHLQR